MLQVHRSTLITDQSSIGEARRTAVQLAQTMGFDEERRSDLAIAVTELATNVLLHARGGEILACPFVREDGSGWLDVLALDAGPGIRDVTRAMEDGFSTSGTAGQGLGAVKRAADESSLYSVAGKGTVSWCRFRLGPEAAAGAIGVVSVPVKGEPVCGDGFVCLPGARRSLFAVVDGLGHGTGANEAAEEAITMVLRHGSASVSEILQNAHDALKKTRGAAMSVAVVDHEMRTCNYAGVGNVTSVLLQGTTSRGLISQNGTLGVAMPRTVQEYTCPVERNMLLVMYSDGLHSRALGSYTGVQQRHPMVVAGLFYRDFTRRRDDATVLVAPVGTASV